ncbi:MAG TPA: hypothetical protein VIV60_17280 [Polyangiaceae bacterium]
MRVWSTHATGLLWNLHLASLERGVQLNVAAGSTVTRFTFVSLAARDNYLAATVGARVVSAPPEARHPS